MKSPHKDRFARIKPLCRAAHKIAVFQDPGNYLYLESPHKRVGEKKRYACFKSCTGLPSLTNCTVRHKMLCCFATALLSFCQLCFDHCSFPRQPKPSTHSVVLFAFCKNKLTDERWASWYGSTELLSTFCSQACGSSSNPRSASLTRPREGHPQQTAKGDFVQA